MADRPRRSRTQPDNVMGDVAVAMNVDIVGYESAEVLAASILDIEKQQTESARERGREYERHLKTLEQVRETVRTTGGYTGDLPPVFQQLGVRRQLAGDVSEISAVLNKITAEATKRVEELGRRERERVTFALSLLGEQGRERQGEAGADLADRMQEFSTLMERSGYSVGNLQGRAQEVGALRNPERFLPTLLNETVQVLANTRAGVRPGQPDAPIEEEIKKIVPIVSAVIESSAHRIAPTQQGAATKIMADIIKEWRDRGIPFTEREVGLLKDVAEGITLQREELRQAAKQDSEKTNRSLEEIKGPLKDNLDWLKGAGAGVLLGGGGTNIPRAGMGMLGKLGQGILMASRVAWPITAAVAGTQLVTEGLQLGQEYTSITGGTSVAGAVGYEAKARLMALSPFLSTGQSQEIIQKTLRMGYKGGEANTIMDYIADNVADGVATIDESLEFFSLGVGEAGGSLAELSAHLRSLQRSAVDSGRDFEGMKDQFTFLTKEWSTILGPDAAEMARLSQEMYAGAKYKAVREGMAILPTGRMLTKIAEIHGRPAFEAEQVVRELGVEDTQVVMERILRELFLEAGFTADMTPEEVMALNGGSTFRQTQGLMVQYGVPPEYAQNAFWAADVILTTLRGGQKPGGLVETAKTELEAAMAPQPTSFLLSWAQGTGHFAYEFFGSFGGVGTTEASRELHTVARKAEDVASDIGYESPYLESFLETEGMRLRDVRVPDPETGQVMGLREYVDKYGWKELYTGRLKFGRLKPNLLDEYGKHHFGRIPKKALDIQFQTLADYLGQPVSMPGTWTPELQEEFGIGAPTEEEQMQGTIDLHPDIKSLFMINWANTHLPAEVAATLAAAARGDGLRNDTPNTGSRLPAIPPGYAGRQR